MWHRPARRAFVVAAGLASVVLASGVAGPAGSAHASTDGYTVPGQLWMMGRGLYGNLGTGNPTHSELGLEAPQPDSAVAVQPLWGPLGRTKDVSVGVSHTLAIHAGAHVVSWGANDFGQLGLGYASPSRNRPALVPGIPEPLAVEAGTGFSVALTKSGQVYTWGSNRFGELGHGDKVDRFTPTLVTGLPPIIQIAVGSRHVLALGAFGRVFGWGWNNTLQATGERMLGVAVPSPKEVEGMPDDVVRVFAGRDQSFAERADRSLWAWGDNTYRALCLGKRSIPDTVPAPPTPTAFTGRVRDLDTRYVTAIVAPNGEVRTCGSWPLGRDGDGWFPATLSGVTDVRQVAVGTTAVYLRLGDGSVYGWGAGEHGVLGGIEGSETAVLIPGVTAEHIDSSGATVGWIEAPAR